MPSGKLNRLLRQIVAIVVMVTYSASCTTLPSGEKAFDTFESCFASNIALAAAGGLLTGIVTTKIAGRDAGIAAGVAVGALIGIKAWKKCAIVYSKSEQIVQNEKTLPQPAAATRRTGPNLSRLEIKVEGTENDAPTPEFDFAYFNANPAQKDIKAKLHHKVEIVRFMAGEKDQLFLADANGAALQDSAGKPVPVTDIAKVSRDRLQWVTIAEEGKEDYVEDIIIQQSARTSYRHKLHVPPRDKMNLPLPMPMRYTVTLVVDGEKSARSVDFSILPTKERPRRFVGQVFSPMAGSQTMPGTPAGSTPGNSNNSGNNSSNSGQRFTATSITKNRLGVFSETGPARTLLTTLKKGARVEVQERTRIEANKKYVEWARIRTESGVAGWVPTSELLEIKK